MAERVISSGVEWHDPSVKWNLRELELKHAQG
jgi:hypothetical protein